MNILSAAEMQAADRATSQDFHVPLIELMEEAGWAVARFILRELSHCRRVAVVCGRGNNGGDGFVAARRLQQAGLEVSVVVLGDPGEIHGEAEVMLRQLPSPPVVIRQEQDFSRQDLTEIFRRSELFVDAVLGTGFHPPLRGLAVGGRDMLNRFPGTPVVAIDLPSGWDADSREFAVREAYRADAVVTFTAPKPAHVFGLMTEGELSRRGSLKGGAIVVAPIGSPPGAVVSELGLSWAGSSKRIADAPRHADANKGTFGHVLVIGGERGRAGAPSMAATAALRTGAGLVTAAVAESILPTVAGITPELMTMPLIEGAKGEISSKNLEDEVLGPLLEKKSVIALGPGLGQEPEAVAFVLGLLEKVEVPIVIDADGLNALAPHVGRLRSYACHAVLTPHPGEMARLIGKSIADVQANREAIAQEFATKHNVTLVLKGWRTLIAHPDGSLVINTTGNPGLSKGGSGDILTGIVAAMLSQYGHLAAEAVNAAVYLHGLAADFAVRAQDQHTLLALDTVAHLFQAFRFHPEDQNGYVWLKGLPGMFTEVA